MNLKKETWSLKKIAVMTALVLAAAVASSREAVFSSEDYDLNVSYNDTAAPGDAVFVRMTFSQANKKTKTPKSDFYATTGMLTLSVNGKKSRTAQFYPVSKTKDGKNFTLLAGIPLSSWWTKDNELTVNVEYKLFGGKNKSFDMPFRLTEKNFDSETLELDAKNSAIRTDTSPKRMEQIQKLNAILQTVNPASVWTTSPFTSPTDSTRYTAHFGDRRVYAYTNGKSSTSLHFGNDYGIPTGSQVAACADGKVVLAENRISTGYSIVVEHLPGLYSLYYHLSEMKVKEGDSVKGGDLIGLSGATGLATGPHLHWEVRLNAEAVAPEFFMNDFAFN